MDVFVFDICFLVQIFVPRQYIQNFPIEIKSVAIRLHRISFNYILILLISD